MCHALALWLAAVTSTLASASGSEARVQTPAGRRRRPRPVWWIHVPFALVVILSLVPRAMAVAGIRPVLFFHSDSFQYLIGAQQGEPLLNRPYGYSAFLRLMAWTDQLWLVPVVQHLAAVGLAVVMYRWLLSRGAPIWLAVAVPTPFLLDGYQIAIEHIAVTETFFTVLLMGVALMLMRDTVTLPVAAGAGALLAVAALTRTVAVPLVLLYVGYLLVRRVGWRPLLVFCATFSLPLLLYATWFAQVHGSFALQQDGRFLYARVAQIADCTTTQVPESAKPLCEPTIPSTRPGPNFYAWSADSPFATAEFPDGTDRVDAARQFATAVIVAQPGDYLRMVAQDTAQYFLPGRAFDQYDTPPSWWNIPRVPAAPTQQLSLSGSGFNDDSTSVVLDQGVADTLRTWQQNLGTQGPLLLAGIVLAVVGAWRGRHRRGGVRREDGLLLAGLGVGLLLVASATAVFDYRYGLPAAPLLYLAGGTGALALLQRNQPVPAPPHEPAIGESAPGGRRAASRARRLRGAAALAAVVLVLGVLLAPIGRSDIYARYLTAGAERGLLGYPVSEVEPSAQWAGWTQRDFEGGVIARAPDGTTVAIETQALREYQFRGGVASQGLPTGSTRTFDDDSSATWFTQGAIVQRADGRTLTVDPPILDAWCVPGRVCALGPPTAPAQQLAGGAVRQEFTGGAIAVRADGSVRVARNDAAAAQ